VYSEPQKGSTFKVYLPRVEGSVEDAPAKHTPLKEQRGTETVLLVEDEQAVRDLVSTILTQQGFRVIVARNPRDAEEIASRHREEVHLLLTDVVMPGTSGRELAARIMVCRPDIRVLYMSGYTENLITRGGMLEEGLAFLQKPFSPVTLLQRIREVLDHAPKKA
jgi:DNA-binding response OmpR family regulator